MISLYNNSNTYHNYGGNNMSLYNALISEFEKKVLKLIMLIIILEFFFQYL